MGAGAFGIWKLLILLGIVFMIFGSKKLKNLGSDLGSAIKGFKNALDEGKAAADAEAAAKAEQAQPAPQAALKSEASDEQR
jgi:twin arginine-targeting protein translocase, TatA/E family